MQKSNIVLGVVTLLLAAVLLHPRLRGWRAWRAVVTPLASIIGSGFLVAGPILSHAAGRWAWVAMAVLCGIGYFYGAAIRHNIGRVEPLLADGAPSLVRGVETASDLALAAAYFVSVSYYLNLLAAFGLKGLQITDPVWVKVTATVVIAAIGIVGLTRGLAALERIETVAVGGKLAVIGGLCAALAVANAQLLTAGKLSWPDISHTTGLAEVQVILGLVILVQGFETSRYLGAEYDAATRIRTMRWAQILAAGIYMVFIVLATAFFTGDLPGEGGETAIIELLQPVGILVAPLVIVAALASQLSAAVADTNGAGGLLSETSGGRLPVRTAYALTAAVAVAITWTADIYGIITYASKAFVLYYGLQSLQAALVCQGQGAALRRWLFGAGAVLALVIVVFAKSAAV